MKKIVRSCLSVLIVLCSIKSTNAQQLTATQKLDLINRSNELLRQFDISGSFRSGIKEDLSQKAIEQYKSLFAGNVMVFDPINAKLDPSGKIEKPFSLNNKSLEDYINEMAIVFPTGSIHKIPKFNVNYDNLEKGEIKIILERTFSGKTALLKIPEKKAKTNEPVLRRYTSTDTIELVLKAIPDQPIVITSMTKLGNKFNCSNCTEIDFIEILTVVEKDKKKEKEKEQNRPDDKPNEQNDDVVVENKPDTEVPKEKGPGIELGSILRIGSGITNWSGEALQLGDLSDDSYDQNIDTKSSIGSQKFERNKLNSSFELGLTAAFGEKHNYGIGVGLQYSKWSGKITLPELQNQYKDSLKNYEVSYNRLVTVHNMEEELKFSEMRLPLTAFYDIGNDKTKVRLEASYLIGLSWKAKSVCTGIADYEGIVGIDGKFDEYGNDESTALLITEDGTKTDATKKFEAHMDIYNPFALNENKTGICDFEGKTQSGMRFGLSWMYQLSPVSQFTFGTTFTRMKYTKLKAQTTITTEVEDNLGSLFTPIDKFSANQFTIHAGFAYTLVKK